MPVGIGAENDAAYRPNKVRQTERAERQQDRNLRVAIGKKCLREIRGEIAVDRDVIPFQRIADRRRNDKPRDILSSGPICAIPGNSSGTETVMPDSRPTSFFPE